MEEDSKKISFSFKQISSKSKVVNLASKPLEKTVQFIDCVEEKSIKVFGQIENNHHELVIPMPPSTKRPLRLPAELVPTKNGIENNSKENGVSTLDEMAVQAILSDCQKTDKDKEEETKIVEVPMIVDPPEGKEVSTAEDYLNVPVSQFGLAMLRGMGWESTKGIGKNSQVITSSPPELRPKGMGLGADKLIKSVQIKQATEEELKLKDGSYVQFLLGRLDGQYGQVMGFDEGASRVMVKIARTSQMEKVNENTFRLVTKNDYDKNSKVINIKEYKEYHEGSLQSNNSEDRSCHHKKKYKEDVYSERFVDKIKSNEREDRSRHREKKDKEDMYSNNRSRHHKTKKSKHSKSPHRKHKSDHNKHKKYKHKRSSS